MEMLILGLTVSERFLETEALLLSKSMLFMHCQIQTFMRDAERVQNIWKVHLHISGKSSSLDYKRFDSQNTSQAQRPCLPRFYH